jgi:hypothetical protein
MRQKIQIVLILCVVVAGIRLAWIFWERHEDAARSTGEQQTAPINPDYYFAPKKLYAYDLKSAKQLTKQPVWIKVGYAYPYFAYDPGSKRANLNHEAGKLLPLQRLEIKDVVTGTLPDTRGKKEVLAIFQQDGKSYATPVGTEQDGDYKFYSDDMMFIEDPHQLYKHWPSDIWQEIDKHQVKQGMSELQADFAIGIGLLEPGSDSIDRTLDYPNGGNPLKISFHDGKAIQIGPGPKS